MWFKESSEKLPDAGKDLAKVVKWLGSFQIIIGIIPTSSHRHSGKLIIDSDIYNPVILYGENRGNRGNWTSICEEAC